MISGGRERERELPRLRQEAESRCQVSMQQAWPGHSQGSVHEPCAVIRGPAGAPQSHSLLFPKFWMPHTTVPLLSVDFILLRPRPPLWWGA